VNLTSDGNFHGSYQAWKAARLAGRIRWHKPILLRK
jgi:hypothetical protein